MNPLT